MAMLILLDSNYRASFRYGSRQLLPVFSEDIQAKIRGAPDRTSLVSQITYCMRSSPSASKMALIFGSFENMLTGRRSEIQHFPMAVVQTEVGLYAKMIRDLLMAYPSVSVFVLAPLFRSQPAWYDSVYGELSNLFCSVISHVDPARVKVVPPVDINASNLDPAGIHFDQDGQKLVLAQLLASFSDGIFVNPEQYPLVENIGLYLYISSSLLIILFSNRWCAHAILFEVYLFTGTHPGFE
jgi:hypothetical protein